MILLLACLWLDDQALLLRVDQDGDGYWSHQFGGFDCDDANPNVHPGADEVCNGLDDDCRPANDALLQTWYVDADGDGFGAEATLTCLADPTGWSTQGGDCDDENAAVNPLQNEVCGDGADNDCDGRVDCIGDLPVTLADSDIRILGSAEQDGLGADILIADGVLFATASNAGDFGLWRFEDLVSGRREDGERVVFEPVWGLQLAERDGEPPTEVLMRLSSGFASLDGSVTDPRQLHQASDLDGDGLDELVVEEKLQQDHFLVVEGAGVELLRIEVSATRTAVGDVDGDGHPDLVYVSRDPDLPSGGIVQLLYEPLSAEPLGARWEGEAWDAIGDSLDVADLDGDTCADIGFSYREETALVFLGGSPDAAPLGFMEAADADLIVEGAASTLSALGDLDGDGGRELLLQPNEQYDWGVVWRGPWQGLYEVDGGPLPNIDSAATVDVDGDGFEDLVVGDRSDSTGGERAGIVAVLFGP